MQNIIVPIDFSPIARPVVELAETLAEYMPAHVWLIHVAGPDPDFVGYEVGPQSVRDQVADHLRDEHQQLQSIAARLRKSGTETTALLVQGPTAAKILSEAESHAADLIVMGSHGRGAMIRALLGSVSEQVLRKAHCPVIVVPHRLAESS